MIRFAARIGWGVVVWAIPFVIGMALFHWQETAFFDSMMAVSLTTGTCLVGWRHARRHGPLTGGRALGLGLLWMAVCLAIDVPLFLGGLGWSLHAYVADVGLGYVIVPVVTVSMTWRGMRPAASATS